MNLTINFNKISKKLINNLKLVKLNKMMYLFIIPLNILIRIYLMKFKVKIKHSYIKLLILNKL